MKISKQLPAPILTFACCAAFLLAFAICVLSSGCSPANQAPANAKAITDAYGRTIEVPSSVNSVATVGSGARFVVYAGGAEGVTKLTAVTAMETTPAANRPYTMMYASTFEALPSTSNGNHLMETSVDIEALLQLHPDVIVSSRSAAECDKLQSDLGIPVVGISYQDHLFTDDVYASIMAVGEAIGTAEHAQASVDALKRWAADLAERGEKGRAGLAQSSTPEPVVYVGAMNYKGAKSFGGTFQHYAPIDALGAKNAADELGGTGSVEVNLEQLGAWNPDVLFLNTDNLGLLRTDYAANRAFLSQLEAFQKGNLFSQPSFNFNGTNIELGICNAYFIGATIYPAAFADLDMAAQYDEVFRTLLGGAYYEQLKARGMDFARISM